MKILIRILLFPFVIIGFILALPMVFVMLIFKTVLITTGTVMEEVEKRIRE